MYANERKSNYGTFAFLNLDTISISIMIACRHKKWLNYHKINIIHINERKLNCFCLPTTLWAEWLFVFTLLSYWSRHLHVHVACTILKPLNNRGAYIQDFFAREEIEAGVWGHSPPDIEGYYAIRRLSLPFFDGKICNFRGEINSMGDPRAPPPLYEGLTCIFCVLYCRMGGLLYIMLEIV